MHGPWSGFRSKNFKNNKKVRFSWQKVIFYKIWVLKISTNLRNKYGIGTLSMVYKRWMPGGERAHFFSTLALHSICAADNRVPEYTFHTFLNNIKHDELAVEFV